MEILYIIHVGTQWINFMHFDWFLRSSEGPMCNDDVNSLFSYFLKQIDRSWVFKSGISFRNQFLVYS